MIQTNIIVNLSVEGIHNWPDAKKKMPDVAFLSDKHRHIFNFCLKKKVSHSDRDVEIILFKRSVLEYLYETYGLQHEPDSYYKWCNFGSKSCEMLADELLKQFRLEYCSVLEDNENGAEVYCLVHVPPTVFR